jgi:Type VI secretion system/phage-baseplate injector OB domain
MADSYYGVYGALVDANDTGEGVLRVKVPAVYPGGEVLDARPCLPYGVLFLPEVGEKVWVQFEGGDPTLPLWTGVHQVGDAWPTAPGPPTARLLRSATDHRIVLDDDAPAVAVRYGGKAHAVTLTATAVTIEHDAGHAVTLEQGKVTVALAAGGPSVVLEQGSATVSLGPSSVKLDPSSVTVSGPLVKLGGATAPVVRAGVDIGVGNLGAPVVMTPGQIQVLA